MADLNPIGSEKLKGDEKLQRILQLTYYGNNNVKKNNDKPYELIKETVNGVYGIVKEKDSYYVKKGLNENTLDYIGGMFMKNKNKFSSYAEALKRLELLRSRELNENTKYVLKQNKPTTEAPPTEPAIGTESGESDMGGEPKSAETDAPAPDELSDMNPDDLPMDDEATPEEDGGDEQVKKSDYMAEIQKFSGKLGQELRDQKNRLESDDIKYVLNMIISAVDLNKLDIDDLNDIAEKFERVEDSMPDTDSEEADEYTADKVPDEDSDLEDRISKLEQLINSKFGDDDAEEEPEAELDEEDDFRYMRDIDEYDITPELDEINESIKMTLSKYFK